MKSPARREGDSQVQTQIDECRIKRILTSALILLPSMLVHSLSGLGPEVGREQIAFAARAAGRHNHSFA